MDKPLETGLIGGPEPRAIEIVDYDPRWAAQFRDHAHAVAAALGPRALAIEHVGSTSVAGLAAKPIVDVLLVVENSADEPAYLPALEAAGYVLRVREPDFHEHRMLRTPRRDVHLHVFSHGSVEISRMLAFRNRLRSNSRDRQRYERTKRQLAAQSWADVNEYAKAKSKTVESIIALALAERNATD